MENAMTVRETAVFLGIRMGSVYSLIWGGTLKASKCEKEWIVDRESVQAYRVQRDGCRDRIRRSKSRSVVGRSVIDVAPAVEVMRT
jgi:hypothetical protein